MSTFSHAQRALMDAAYASDAALEASRLALADTAASLEETNAALATVASTTGANISDLQSAIGVLGVRSAEAAPIGAINMFFRSTAPAGWLACNGQEVSRTTYKNLFAEIGTTCGAGDGTTTFNVPDFRDLFLRAWDQSGPRTLGDVQEDAMKSHSHRLPVIKSGDEAAGYGAQAGSIAFGDALAIVHPTSPVKRSSEATGAGTETRPKNVALLCCIKY